jgi:hypothetical protein
MMNSTSLGSWKDSISPIALFRSTNNQGLAGNRKTIGQDNLIFPTGLLPKLLAMGCLWMREGKKL